MKRQKRIAQALAGAALLIALPLFWMVEPARSAGAAQFNVMEAKIEDIHKAYKDGSLTAHQLTQMYLDRIDAYDKHGPMINSVITLNSKALEDADKLDAEFK